MRLLLFTLIIFAFHIEASTSLRASLFFDSSISITNENGVISSGDISYRNGDFLYVLSYPLNQIIASKKSELFVQDNDFNQVIVYNNDKSFFLQELLNGGYELESITCPTECLRIKPNNNSGFKDAMLSMTDETIEWIRLLDIKDEIIFIKFENFKIESTNITYVIPENYEVIKND